MREISFRDPSGFVYMDKEKLLRKIKIDRLNFFENLFSTSWFNELLVQKKISLPAYDQCLKASHVFNVLDARGAISVAQRAGYIGRIRDITKSAAAIWIDSQI